VLEPRHTQTPFLAPVFHSLSALDIPVDENCLPFQGLEHQSVTARQRTRAQGTTAVQEEENWR